MKPWQSSLATSLLAVFLACGGGGSKSSGSTASPPSALSYQANPAIYSIGHPITPNAPSNSGGAATSFSVAPPLPGGLTLNGSNGVISGIPSSISAITSYTIIASNSAGSASTSIAITVNDAPPASLSYLVNPAIYTKGLLVSVNPIITSGGGVPTSYSVSHALPPGLAFNQSTGAISGTPTSVVSSTPYVVTGSNNVGSATANLSITVNDIPPSGLSYSQNPAVYTRGTSIPPNVPSSSGGAVVQYSATPSLPSGLLIDPNSGVITGTPEVPSPPTSYHIITTNSGGSASAILSIKVQDTPPAAPVITLPNFVTSGKMNTSASTQEQGTGVTYTWTLINGTITSGQGSRVIQFTPGAVGSLTATVSLVTSAGNTAGSAQSTVVAMPVAELFAQDKVFYGESSALASVPPQTGMTYQWQLSAGAINSGVSGNVLDYATPTSQGSYQLAVTVQNQAGDSVSQARTLQSVGGRFLKDVTLPSPRAARMRGDIAVLLSSGRVLLVGGDLSNSTCEQWDPYTNTWAFVGSFLHPRYYHTATLLKNGKVLVVGGKEPVTNSPMDSAELFDPATGTWSEAGLLTAARWGHAATLLQDGRVLVSGGTNLYGLQGSHLVETYDPNTNKWSPSSSSFEARNNHSATLLDNGKVLLAGGVTYDPSLATWKSLQTAELFDPVTSLFTLTPNMSQQRDSHLGIQLNNGTVLIVAGKAWLNGGPTYTSTAEMYNPATNTWSVTGSMGSLRAFSEGALLPDGRYLVIGGTDPSIGATPPRATTEVYDPVAGLWSNAGDMVIPRSSPLAVRLANGSILAIGGETQGRVLSNPERYDSSIGKWTSARGGDIPCTGATASQIQGGRILFTGGFNLRGSGPPDRGMIYDPVTRAWTNTSPMITGRYYIGHSTTTLGDGRVLLVGGVTAGVGSTYSYLATAELYDPLTDTWSSAGSLSTTSQFHSAFLLSSGKVMVVGGRNNHGAVSTVELYDPSSNSWTRGADYSPPGLDWTHSGVLLASGKVMISQGPTNAAILYDPIADVWSPTGALPFNGGGPSILLGNGKVFQVGGTQGSASGNLLYDSSSNSWSLAGGTFANPVPNGPLVLLPDGRVLSEGGGGIVGSVYPLAFADVYDPQANSCTSTGGLIGSRYGHTCTLLGNGKVMVMGGTGTYTPEFYKP